MVSKDGELDDAQPEPVPRITEAVFDDLEAPSAAKVPNAEPPILIAPFPK